MKDHI